MRERPIQVHIAGCLAVVLSATTTVQAAMPVSLSPHRAIYDLSLKTRTSGSPVMSVSGRMVHEFTGTPCDGYAVSMRWIAQFGDAQGELVVDDIRFTSFEDSAGEVVQFRLSAAHERLDYQRSEGSRSRGMDRTAWARCGCRHRLTRRFRCHRKPPFRPSISRSFSSMRWPVNPLPRCGSMMSPTMASRFTRHLR